MTSRKLLHEILDADSYLGGLSHKYDVLVENNMTRLSELQEIYIKGKELVMAKGHYKRRLPKEIIRQLDQLKNGLNDPDHTVKTASCLMLAGIVTYGANKTNLVAFSHYMKEPVEHAMQFSNKLAACPPMAFYPRTHCNEILLLEALYDIHQKLPYKDMGQQLEKSFFKILNKSHTGNRNWLLDLFPAISIRQSPITKYNLDIPLPPVRLISFPEAREDMHVVSSDEVELIKDNKQSKPDSQPEIIMPGTNYNFIRDMLKDNASSLTNLREIQQAKKLEEIYHDYSHQEIEYTKKQEVVPSEIYITAAKKITKKSFQSHNDVIIRIGAAYIESMYQILEADQQDPVCITKPDPEVMKLLKNNLNKFEVYLKDQSEPHKPTG